MGLLTRLQSLVRPPAPAPSTGLVPLRLRQKYVHPALGVFNAGEIGGFLPALAERLIATGWTTRVGPHAQPTVRPRPAIESSYRLAARPASEEDTWAAPTADLGALDVLRWPPR